MHDYSLPAADRCDQAEEPAGKPGTPAHVLLLADGNFFKAFRRGRPVLTARTIRNAALFFSDQAIDRVRRKLERRGIAAMPRPVNIVGAGR